MRAALTLLVRVAQAATIAFCIAMGSYVTGYFFTLGEIRASETPEAPAKACEPSTRYWYRI